MLPTNQFLPISDRRLTIFNVAKGKLARSPDLLIVLILQVLREPTEALSGSIRLRATNSLSTPQNSGTV